MEILLQIPILPSFSSFTFARSFPSTLLPSPNQFSLSKRFVFYFFLLYSPKQLINPLPFQNLFKIAQIKRVLEGNRIRSPSESFLMQDIMCKFCSYVRDIDILRDEQILSGDWIVNFVNILLDKNGIEKRLVDILQRKSLAYQLQDLVCSKCDLIKEDNNSLLL